MLRARCQELGCTWTFESNDYAAMNVVRDAHYATHPGRHARYPAMSDDQQRSTGVLHPRPVDD
jgi:hypothetical protein